MYTAFSLWSVLIDPLLEGKDFSLWKIHAVILDPNKNIKVNTELNMQSNLSYLDSCYTGTSLKRVADLPYFMLTLHKLWAIQWVWPIYYSLYIFIAF